MTSPSVLRNTRPSSADRKISRLATPRAVTWYRWSVERSRGCRGTLPGYGRVGLRICPDLCRLRIGPANRGLTPQRRLRGARQEREVPTENVARLTATRRRGGSLGMAIATRD